MSTRRTRRLTIFTWFVSSSLVVVGVSLPWLEVELPSGPGLHEVPAVYVSGMGSGMEAGGWIVLLAVLGSTAAVLYFEDGWKTASFTFIAGGVTVALSLHYIISTFHGNFDVFVPATGVYLTLVGGVGLLLAGGIGLFGDRIPAISDSGQDGYRTNA